MASTRASVVSILVVLGGAAGCAHDAPRPPPRSGGLDAALDAWVSADTSAGTPVRSTTLFEARPPSGHEPPARAPAFTGPVTLRQPVAPPSRPRRGPRVDVSFHGADMTNAFQFLADEGRFNLVVQDGLGGHVSATLHGVDAYDALVSLAEANGATVAYDGQVVVVKKR